MLVVAFHPLLVGFGVGSDFRLAWFVAHRRESATFTRKRDGRSFAKQIKLRAERMSDPARDAQGIVHQRVDAGLALHVLEIASELKLTFLVAIVLGLSVEGGELTFDGSQARLVHVDVSQVPDEAVLDFTI